METQVKINESNKERDYFPCIFANKDKSIVILADGRTGDQTFSGMIIHASGDKGKKTSLGRYESGWTYTQFKRLPKDTALTLEIKQDD